MSLGTWTQIKSGLKTLVATMTNANNYVYNWTQYNRENIYQPSDIYVTVHTPDGEENKDKDNYVGTGRFDNERVVKFYLYVENLSSKIPLDEVIEQCKDKLELALDDFNNRFNGIVPNELCSAGVYSFDYKGFVWEMTPKSSIYAPVKMRVNYLCKYRKNRNIS